MSRKNKLSNKNSLPTQVEVTEPLSLPIEQPPTQVELIEPIEPPSVETTSTPPLPSLRYNIVSVINDTTLFTIVVNKHLSEGWQLQGGVSVSHITTDYSVSSVYTQAIIKNS